MKRLYHFVLTIVIAAATGQMCDGDPPAAAERDPAEVFRKACELVAALEGKDDLPKGVSRAKPVIERDEKERLKSARLVFARNATTPGKNAAKAIDTARPFFYLSVEVWAGRTQTPPGGLHEFEWKGETYQMWIRIYGSDAALVKMAGKSVDEPLRGPFARKNPGKK